MKNNSENLKTKNTLKKRVYFFAIKILKLVDDTPNDKSSRIICDQLVRAATSIGANYIEAQAASSKRDFTNFFHHALKSANETKFWLGLLRDSKKMNEERINPLLQEAKEIGNILGSSILTLKGKNKF